MISESKSAFQLKGSLFTLTIMQLHHCNLSELKTQLAETIKKSPKLFQDAPIVLDFNNVDLPEEQIELENLIKVLREFNLYTVGIRTQSELLKTKAKLINLAILASKNDTAPATKKAAAPLNANKLITQPVRSGQQIYAANGDLIILASVSAGAEVLADGNIHIYGALRGRALAGIKGETDKRIFCKSLEAELISIAGHYLVNENLEQYKHLAWTQISLEDEQLKIEAI